MLDGILHRVHIVQIMGDSYRPTKQKKAVFLGKPGKAAAQNSVAETRDTWPRITSQLTIRLTIPFGCGGATFFYLMDLRNFKQHLNQLVSVRSSLVGGSPQERVMSYLDSSRDTYGMYKRKIDGPGPELMGAGTLLGEDVYNGKGEKLGHIKEIMLKMSNGMVAYAVLSFGGILGMGDKLFVVPWEALTLDTENKRFVLNVEKERLQSAPGFDKEEWPDLTDPESMGKVHSFYGLPSNEQANVRRH